MPGDVNPIVCLLLEVRIFFFLFWFLGFLFVVGYGWFKCLEVLKRLENIIVEKVNY